MTARLTALVAGLVVLAGVAAGPRRRQPGDPPGALTVGGTAAHLRAARSPAPSGLVINLHGAGQTGGEQAAVTNYNAVADQYGFVVAYPTGSTSAGPTAAAPRCRTARVWTTSASSRP